MDVTDTTLGVVKYDATDASLTELSEKYAGLTVKGPYDEAGFKAVHNARMIIKNERCEIEKARKQFKAGALAYGRRVDAEAKRLTAIITPVEEHLISQEKIVTDEQERIKREAEEAEAARLEAIEREKREAEEARIRAEREAEEKRLAEERERLAAERAEMEAAQKAERERIAAIEAAQKAEADNLAAEKARLEEIERERQRAIELEKAKAEAAAKAKADAERAAEEARLREEAAKKEAEAERKRLEALRPDTEKIRAYGDSLIDVLVPTLATEEARQFLNDILVDLAHLRIRCMDFNAEPVAVEG